MTMMTILEASSFGTLRTEVCPSLGVVVGELLPQTEEDEHLGKMSMDPQKESLAIDFAFSAPHSDEHA
jgi:hypothetical protein